MVTEQMFVIWGLSALDSYLIHAYTVNSPSSGKENTECYNN